MSRVTQDVEAVRMYVQQGTLRTLDISVRVVGSLYLISRLNPRLSLITFIFVPILAAQSIYVSSRLRPYWSRIQNGMGIVGTILQENLTAMRVVKAFAREDYESAKFRRAAEQLFEDSYTSNQIQSFNMPTMVAVWTLSIVITVFYGGNLVLQGQLKIGELAACMLYQQLLQGPMRQLGFIVHTLPDRRRRGSGFSRSSTPSRRSRRSPTPSSCATSTGHVRFENVSFGYDAISAVLQRREHRRDARRGRRPARPDRQRQDDRRQPDAALLRRHRRQHHDRRHDIRDVTLASLRTNIGIVQQDVFLFIGTIRENIAYGRRGRDRRKIIEAAKLARIHDFIMTLPDGYDTWVGERGVTLSGGQKQRISIARTLLLDPQDPHPRRLDLERRHGDRVPDPAGAGRADEGPHDLRHRPAAAHGAQADQIVVLKDGKIVERGRHEELIERERPLPPDLRPRAARPGRSVCAQCGR